jgi:hypothetical protein
MILFNWKLAAGHDDEPEHPLHILSIRLDRETSDCITNFVLDNVFVEEGKSSHLLFKFSFETGFNGLKLIKSEMISD